MQEFVVGQRWISAAELQLGLGMVTEIEHRTVSIVFPATGENRLYARADAPLSRVRFAKGDSIASQAGEELIVVELAESAGLIIYHCEDEVGKLVQLPEGRLNHSLQLNQPAERLLNSQIDRNKWYNLRCQAREIANHLQQSSVFGLAGCRTSLIAHQLYIANEVSRRYAPRVLLADEVGLGKTIEAGLILHQQLLLERAHRALIVVPESLVHQWLVEMLRRFNLIFTIFNPARFDQIENDDDSIEAGENPFQQEQLVLCSTEFLLQNSAYAEFARNGDWDLLVVDEAHHLHWSPDGASAEYRLIEQLAEQTAGLLLLTATPEQLGKESHFARLRLLDPNRFSDLDQFLIEEKGYQQLADKVEGLLDEGGASQELDNLLDQHGTGRVLFRNTRQVVKGFPARDVHPIELTDSSPNNAYLEWLGQFLRDHREKKVLVIVSAASAAKKLVNDLKSKSGLLAALFYEDMTLVERDRAAAWFADQEEGAQVLVCSEIGSEGRNFQFAHHLVLFDLPVNPDLLEQRIGRLDRIGQNAVINIYVPYLEGSAQQVLFRWYHEGMNAFCQTCPAGHQVYLETHEQLQRHLQNPEEPLEGLIEKTQKLHQQLNLALQLGRDRLLEINSCRPLVADALIEEAMQRETEFDLFTFMERIYDCYGVNSDIRDRDSWVISPGDNMLAPMPGLPDEGMTVTYDRSAALANEDLHYLTWEHPFVRNSMELILSSEFGNTALVAMKYAGVSAGTLLVECRFLMDFTGDSSSSGGRYFPTAGIWVIIDEAGLDHAGRSQFEASLTKLQSVDHDTAIKVVKAREAELKKMLSQAEIKANQQVGDLVAAARTRGQQNLGQESERLINLQKMNSGVRDEEIRFFQNQLESFELSLTNARLRLDAVRVIVAI